MILDAIMLLALISLAVALLYDFFTDKLRDDNSLLEIEKRQLQIAIRKKHQRVLAQWIQNQNTQGATIALLELEQRRMDRCQSEQLWALGGYVAFMGFALSQKELRQCAELHAPLWWSVAALFIITSIFICHQHIGYYQHRHSLTLLAAKLPNAPSYMTADTSLSLNEALRRRLRSWPSVSWCLTFLLGLLLPVVALWLLK